MKKTLSGIQYFLDGFELIGKPGLRRFVIIPALINILLFTALFLLARHYVLEFNTWFAAHVPHWLEWLSAVLWVIFFISFFIFFMYAFVTLGNLVSAPFNSLLAEKVEWYLTGNVLEAKSLGGFIKDLPQMFARQFSIIFFYLLGAMFILILFLVPLIQSIAPALWFLFNAWFLALTYMDYPSDNHHVPLGQVRRRLRRQPGLTLVFGACVLGASLIPIVNFFTIPAAVAGATKLWLLEFDKEKI